MQNKNQHILNRRGVEALRSNIPLKASLPDHFKIMQDVWRELAPIWGLKRWEMTFDDQRWWKTLIKNPFFQDGKWSFALNEKFLREARYFEVDKIVVMLGDEEEGKEIMAIYVDIYGNEFREIFKVK